MQVNASIPGGLDTRGGTQSKTDLDSPRIGVALRRLVFVRSERIVVLKFFGGLSNEEVAETVGLWKRTLDRQCAYARAWLFRYISQEM